MRCYIVSLISLVVLTTLTRAQNPDPVRILHSADSACQLLRTVAFHGRTSGGPAGKPDWTRDGYVTLKRLDTDNPVGAMVNIRVNDGLVYAYNGHTLNLLQPSKQQILVAGPEEQGSAFLTGNVIGHLIPQAFVRDSHYVDMVEDAREIVYGGTVDVDGVPCHLIRIRYNDTELMSDIASEVYLGTSDYLPRRGIVNYVFNDTRQQQQLDLADLKRNVATPDSLFALKLPDGYSYEQYVRPRPPELLAEGDVAPDWTLESGAGSHVSLSALRGKLVLLDFWYTTCGPCLMAMPTIQKLHEQFGERGLAVFGVNPWQQDSAEAVRLMERKGYTYGLLVNGKDVATDYHVSAYPTFYLIGDDGAVLFRGAGYGEEREKEMAAIIEKYLHEHGR